MSFRINKVNLYKNKKILLWMKWIKKMKKKYGSF